jgi:CRISPR-associated protein Cas6/Cse3/CasE subtype I-E
MFLSVLDKIDGDDYKIHQYVRSIFEGDQKVMFQVTDSNIIVISENKVANIESQEIDLNKYKGGSYSFSIRLNPSKRDIKTGKKVRLEPTSIKAWIKDKLEKNGINARFQYIPEGIRNSKKGDNVISLNSVLCFGSFTVSDFSLFYKAVSCGIGSGKGLGFGMLNIF